MLYTTLTETFGNGLGGLFYIVAALASLNGIKAAMLRTFGK